MYFANRENYIHRLPENLDDSVFDQLKEQVWDTEPEDLRNLPLVVISGSSGNMITSGLGDFSTELYTDDGELYGYRYGGIYEFSLTVEVATRSTLEREVLTDLVSSALRFSVRRKMEAEGILVKDMRYGGESTLNYTSDHIYISTINLATWSEWYEDVELLPVEKVSINFDEKKF
jgi:hypothetical protein